MLKLKLTIAALLLISVSFSSCGIFGKGCGCPKFGKTGRNDVEMCKYADAGRCANIQMPVNVQI